MKKDIIVILLIVMLCAVFILNTDFKTVEQYYLEHAQDVAEGEPSVFISIDCSVILENMDNLDPALKDLIPENGVILAKTQYALRDGDTVFDILSRAVKTNRLQMEYQGSSNGPYGSVYVEGIAYIYEFSCGELSGWNYTVNGKIPQLGASSYTLSDGDVIEWIYTCDVSRDILQGGANNE